MTHYNSVNSNDKLREIIENFQSKYTDFSNEITYSKRLYEIYKILKKQNLDQEQKRIVDVNLKNFELN
ncbi:MAG: hypothetical protein ACOZBL_02515 [Patescibacteria group bacterium]